VPPTSATGCNRPLARPEGCADSAGLGDGEPGELGDVELTGELADAELGDPAADPAELVGVGLADAWLGEPAADPAELVGVGLADAELGITDVPADVTVNGSAATRALPPAAG
jgi:hypothetical protein